MLPGIVTVITPRQFPTISQSTIQCFRSSCSSRTISDEKIYTDLRDSLGYTGEIEKLSRSDSKLSVTIELRNPLAKKLRLRVWGYANGEHLYILTHSSLTLK